MVQSDKDLGKALDEALTDPDRFGRLKKEIGEPELSQSSVPAPIATPTRDDGSWSTQGHPHASGYSVLDDIVDSGRSIATPEAHVRTRDAVRAFVRLYVVEERPAANVTPEEINARVAQLDVLMSEQLSEIMHSPEFQKLEASWRGLRHVVWMTRKAPSVKVRVLNVSKKELLQNFRQSPEFKQSALARRIRIEEFETLGGEPYGLLVSDFEFGPEPEDQELLEGISRVGASAHMPFLAAPRPSLLGVLNFGELPGASNLSDVHSRDECVRWCAFRSSPRSRYIGMALPRVLLRNRYGREGRRLQEFNFEEAGGVEDRSSYLWGSAAWALATRLANDFERYGWFGGPRDPGDTGAIKGLPAHSTWSGTEMVTVGLWRRPSMKSSRRR
jgi:type VI secretion system protein ImpC